MKKTLSRLMILFALIALPGAGLYAQESDPIIIDDVAPDGALEIPATGPEEQAEETPGSPDTGLAPSSRVAQNTAVFVGGSVIGAGFGFGIIAMRKRLQTQEAASNSFDSTDN